MSKKTLGIMLDCSRNAVMKPEQVMEFANLAAGMGYNMLMLYTEDTYELEGDPYFGYMRGRYTREELRAIDTHCQNIGMELIPCIQVLAHMNQLKYMDDYSLMYDCNDILMVGEERVYQLINKMFDTLEACFTTRRAHIG
ncbi:MAG: beta-N-acetylhexosaminidase, partial [Oscillospiraceae bacterium]|nr:beta-N-acetylhexosaminidase [Oscillospiraceae bacterium]